MQTYSWPVAAALMKLEQVLLPQLTANSMLFKLFPIRETDAAQVVYQQRDSYQGLMQGRGYDGDFPRVPAVGTTHYVKTPGVYGERDDISEFELTTRAAPGTLGVPVSIDTLVLERQEKLATRRVNRMQWVLAQLITTGNYIVPGPTGAVIDRDSYVPQQYTAPVGWGTPATARPIFDFEQVQLLQRGSSVSFGSTAMALMNQYTFNNYRSNTNAGDLGGIKAMYGQTVYGLDNINRVQQANNVPEIVIDDSGYLDESNVFQLWIPNNLVVLVGRRANGAAIGEFLLTRNVSNGNNSSAPLFRVVDRGMREDEPPPRRIEVFSGLNGGPAVYYPGSIVLLHV